MSELSQLAEEAFTYCFPLYEMARMRAATARGKLDPPSAAPAAAAGTASATSIGAPTGGTEERAVSSLRWCNVFSHSRQLLSAGNTRVVTPNNDTLYSAAWVDLRKGPQVIDVPETHGRYYVLGLLDMYTNPFASVGTRTTGTHPRSFLLTPPGWSDPLPSAWQAPGAHIACTTHWIWIIGRTLIDNEQELDAVHAVQDGFVIQGLDGAGPSQFDPAFAPEFLGQRPPSAQQFLKVVNGVLIENPPSIEQQSDLARFAPLGIGAEPGGLDQPIDAQCKDLIDQAIANCLARWRDADIGQRSSTGWQSMPLLGPSFGSDHTRRAVVALKYIGALESRDAYYPMAFHDAAGQTLRGQHSYRIRFEADALPPVDSFWSITMYSSADRMLVPNPLNRYAIGDRTAGLQWDANGSLTLCISHQAPTDAQAQANWLPAPAGDFYLCLRAYVPQAAMLDGSYTLPAVVRLD